MNQLDALINAAEIKTFKSPAHRGTAGRQSAFLARVTGCSCAGSAW